MKSLLLLHALFAPTIKDTLRTFPNLHFPPPSSPRAHKIVSALNFHPTAPQNCVHPLTLHWLVAFTPQPLKPKGRQHLSRTLKLPASNACVYRSFKSLHAYLADARSSTACFSLISSAIARARTFLLTSSIKVFEARDPWSPNRALRASITQAFRKDFGGYISFDVATDTGPVPSAFISDATPSGRPQRVSFSPSCLNIKLSCSIISSTKCDQYVNMNICSNEQRRVSSTATNPYAVLGLDSPGSSQPYQSLH